MDTDSVRAPSGQALVSDGAAKGVSTLTGFDPSRDAILTLPLNGIYFDQIADGTKREEYRLAGEYWTKRLHGRSYSAVVLTRGYPKGGGIEGFTRLTREWRGFTEKEITHPHFGGEPVRVFALDVSKGLTVALD